MSAIILRAQIVFDIGQPFSAYCDVESAFSVCAPLAVSGKARVTDAIRGAHRPLAVLFSGRWPNTH